MISNGGNFQVAARLAYITRNETYADWAEMVWDWMADSLMFDRNAEDGLLYIWDNVNADMNCTNPVKFIWSYNYGVLLGGLAYMYNYTDGDQVWKDRIDEVLGSAITLYFPDDNGGIMEEFLCEENLLCNQDQKSFKAYLSRWMAVTAMLVPETFDTIHPLIMKSAEAAAGQCTGGSSGTMCSQQWFTNVHTGEEGVGEQVCDTTTIQDSANVPQMSALSVVGASLMTPDMAPLSAERGAESTSDPGAGMTHNGPQEFADITTGDQAGAAILTILVCVGFVGSMVWIVLGE